MTWDILLKLIAALCLLMGFIFALYRFNIWRGRYTALILDVDTKVIRREKNLILTSILIKLENKGRVMITARARKNIKQKGKRFLYDSQWDKCEFAGTLKIRRVPNKRELGLIGWYSFETINDECTFRDGEEFVGDFEQINYLNEFTVKHQPYVDVDFWLEPNEKQEFEILCWLPPDIYGVKVYFLGSKMRKMGEDEYWTTSKVSDLSNKAGLSGVKSSQFTNP